MESEQETIRLEVVVCGEEQEVIKTKKNNVDTALIISGSITFGLSILSIAINIIQGKPIEYYTIGGAFVGLSSAVAGILNKVGYKTEQKEQGSSKK